METEHKKTEEALSYRIDLEKLIISLSTGFINLPSDEIDRGINGALKEIGEFLDVDRSYIFQFSDDGAKADNTHEWCREGIDPQIDNLKGIPVETFPWWMEKLRNFEDIHVPRAADLPPETGAEKERLQGRNIQSLIVVPMISEGELFGFLGLNSVRHERRWEEDVIVLLRIVGEMILNIIHRKQAEEAILESEEKFRITFDQSTIGLRLHPSILNI